MKSLRKAGLLAVLLAVTVSLAAASEISGVYLESRNAEVYASHCFANSELGLRGNLAVMAWRIEQGSWNNVALDGLSVVAVVKASSTLGDPFNNPYPAKAALIVDESASPAQRAALEGLAKHMAGDLLKTVARTDAAPIEMSFDGSIHDRKATLTAGDLVKMSTRAIRETDSLCHLDDLYYAPLVKLDHAMAAFSLQTSFSGEGLGVKFDDRNRSSVYVGTFHVGGSGYTD